MGIAGCSPPETRLDAKSLICTKALKAARIILIEGSSPLQLGKTTNYRYLTQQLNTLMLCYKVVWYPNAHVIA